MTRDLPLPKEPDVTPAPVYSIVIPVYNEALGLSALHERLGALLDKLDGDAEVILVDDGSDDGSYELMADLAHGDRRFIAVGLSRNFGHQVAITAGMDMARGDAIVVMDADLQDPPEVVVEMAARWRQGYDVVYGVRSDRTSDTWFKRTSAEVFYRTLRRLTNVDIPVNVGDFRLIDRRALTAFQAMREGHRFVRGMYSWVGFRQVGVPYVRDERHAGVTKYPLRKMVRLAVDGIVSFSDAPLRLALQAGFVVSGASLFAGIAALVLKVSGAFTVPGWASLAFVICLLGGIQLAVLGLVGMYLGRTYEESLHRPLYIVSEWSAAAPPPPVPERGLVVPRPTIILTEPVGTDPVLTDPVQSAPALELAFAPPTVGAHKENHR